MKENRGREKTKIINAERMRNRGNERGDDKRLNKEEEKKKRWVKDTKCWWHVDDTLPSYWSTWGCDLWWPPTCPSRPRRKEALCVCVCVCVCVCLIMTARRRLHSDGGEKESCSSFDLLRSLLLSSYSHSSALPLRPFPFNHSPFFLLFSCFLSVKSFLLSSRLFPSHIFSLVSSSHISSPPVITFLFPVFWYLVLFTLIFNLSSSFCFIP